MTVVLDGDYFQDRTGEEEVSLSAEAVIGALAKIEVDYPEIVFGLSYWKVSFEYSRAQDSDMEVVIFLLLKNKTRSLRTVFPARLEADYFIIDREFVPIRQVDFLALRELLPLVYQDDCNFLSIRELIAFDYAATKYGFEIANSDFKQAYFADASFKVEDESYGLEIVPYPYQAIGIEWLDAQMSLGRSGVLLCDVMGLGKTLQVIGLLVRSALRGELNNLVVCPGTLVENWRREILKFAPNLKVLVHIGSMRSGVVRGLSGHDVVVTSYDILKQDFAILSEINWNILAADEAQFIKNPEASRCKRLKSLSRKFGIAVTGTPLENKLLDLWSLTDFVDGSIFGKSSDFENRFQGVEGGALEVHTRIRPILLRRRLEDIEHQLPQKVVIDHPLKWPPELADLYETVRLQALQEFPVAGGLVATGRLRKLATHPILMDVVTSDLSALSPKFALCIEIIEELFQNQEKALIFSSYTQMIDGFRGELSTRYPRAFVATLDGRFPMAERSDLVAKFNEFDGPGVLICNPSVAGAGLNITGANHVIHYNLEWNPAKEEQATFRVYRNGQSRETFVHRLFYVDTIDEVINGRLNLKRELADLSVDAGVTNEEFRQALEKSPKK